MKQKKEVARKKSGPTKPAGRKTGHNKRTISLEAAEEPRTLTREDLERWYRPRKEPVTLRLDSDIVAWFKRSGRGYQTRINRALRALMKRERKEAGE